VWKSQIDKKERCKVADQMHLGSFESSLKAYRLQEWLLGAEKEESG
jgi:hypothetical protein